MKKKSNSNQRAHLVPHLHPYILLFTCFSEFLCHSVTNLHSINPTYIQSTWDDRVAKKSKNALGYVSCEHFYHMPLRKSPYLARMLKRNSSSIVSCPLLLLECILVIIFVSGGMTEEWHPIILFRESELIKCKSLNRRS